MQKQSWRLRLAGFCLHLDQAAQRTEAAKLQDPSECPHGERTAAVPGAGAAEAFTKTGRTLQSCKCGKKNKPEGKEKKNKQQRVQRPAMGFFILKISKSERSTNASAFYSGDFSWLRLELSALL